MDTINGNIVCSWETDRNEICGEPAAHLVVGERTVVRSILSDVERTEKVRANLCHDHASKVVTLLATSKLLPAGTR